MPVTRPWRGFGSAVFLELGRLRREPRVVRPGFVLKGRVTVMVEWSWRVEGPRSVVFGSWSGDRKMNRGIDSLKGTRVRSVTLEGGLPELRIAFDDGRALQSFITVESQPVWVLFLEDGSQVSVRRGVVTQSEQFPHLRKKWFGQCLVCQREGYKPDLPAQYAKVRKYFELLVVNDMGECEVCAENRRKSR